MTVEESKPGRWPRRSLPRPAESVAGGSPAHLAIGYVARAHGIHGEVAAKLFDPASRTLLELARVLLRPRTGEAEERRIVSARATPKGVLLSLEGVGGRDAAEALVGTTLLAFREDLGPLAPGEFFQGDLIGLLAVDESGAELGEVEEIWDAGGVPNLVIRRGSAELLVPFADEFVPAVDLEGGRLLVRPPGYEE